MSDFSHDPDFYQFDGFSIYYNARAPAGWSELASPQIVVLVPWGKTPLSLKLRSDRQTKDVEFAFPAAGIIPPQQLFSIQLLNPQPLMVLSLDLTALLQSTPEIVVDSRQPVAGQYGVQDSVLQFVATVLRDRHLATLPDNAVYCRSLAVFLVIHLITTYPPKNIASELPKKVKTERRLEPIFHYIDKNLEQELKVALLAEQAGLSSPQFCRIFKKATGLSPHRYILLQRIDKAKRLLENSAISLSEIALQCGFYDQSHFNLQFRSFTGITPKAYRDTH